MIKLFVQASAFSLRHHTVQAYRAREPLCASNMSSSDDDDALALAACILVYKEMQKKKRSVWCKDWLRRRKTYSHINLLSELKIYPRDWHNYLRMDEDTYLNLLSLVTPLKKKKDTVMREAITPHERLTATLRFLATGRSYEDLKFSTRISPQALSYIVPETCGAIYEVLKASYVKVPQTEEDWIAIARDFEKRWNFPHCLGCIDGKHIQIVPPAGAGSFFFNYKHTHSMVLLAIADANYRFIVFDFGTNGRVSDGGVLQNTEFWRRLQEKSLNIPQEREILISSRILPYVFVADDAFPLRTDMLKPYRQSDLSCTGKKIYNYRLSRARRIVENVFGILAARFRVFHTAINLNPEHIDKVVKAACALHNYLMSTVKHTYVPTDSLDSEDLENGIFRSGLTSENTPMLPLQNAHVAGNIPFDAKQVRQEFMNYFTNEGQVPWQDKFVHNKN